MDWPKPSEMLFASSSSENEHWTKPKSLFFGKLIFEIMADNSFSSLEEAPHPILLFHVGKFLFRSLACL